LDAAKKCFERLPVMALGAQYILHFLFRRVHEARRYLKRRGAAEWFEHQRRGTDFIPVSQLHEGKHVVGC
jgi:hypothetical protein